MHKGSASRRAWSWLAAVGASVALAACGSAEEPLPAERGGVSQPLEMPLASRQPSETPCVFSSDCDDGNLCTSDVCDLLTLTCKYTAVPSCCNRVEDCAGGGLCTLVKCVTHLCLLEPILGCSTGDAATDAPRSDAPTNDGAPGDSGGGGLCLGSDDCNDNEPCSLDLCVAGLCVHASIGGCCHVPNECSNGPLCTLPQCLLNVCVFDPIVGCGGDAGSSDAATDARDGDSGGDTGSAGDATSQDADGTSGDGHDGGGTGACDPNNGATCSDGDACTLDICLPVILECVHAGIAGCCNILHPCPLGELCQSGTCTCNSSNCDAGTDAGGDSGTPGCTGAEDCDDGNACTLDLCTPGSNVCSHAPLDGCGVSDGGSDGSVDTGGDGSGDTGGDVDAAPPPLDASIDHGVDTGANDVTSGDTNAADGDGSGGTTEAGAPDVAGDASIGDASGDTGRVADATTDTGRGGDASIADVGGDAPSSDALRDTSTGDAREGGDDVAADVPRDGVREASSDAGDEWETRGGACSCRLGAAQPPSSRGGWAWVALMTLAVGLVFKRRTDF